MEGEIDLISANQLSTQSTLGQNLPTCRVNMNKNYAKSEFPYDFHVLIVHHSYALSRTSIPTGHVGVLIDFLKKRVDRVIEVIHPFSYSKFFNSTVVLHRRKGKSTILLDFPGIEISDLLLFLKDIIATLFFTLKLRRSFHLYIGVDSLNALIGIFLRKIGLVQKVVFYVIDYTPQRFSSPLKNVLYQFLCRTSAKFSDYIWNLSPRMASVWEKSGISDEKNLIVPGGTFIKSKKPLPLKSIDRKSLVYMGHLEESKGIELIMGALPEILRKVPSAKLKVVGSGPLETRLKNEVKKLRLDNKVDFLGFVDDYDELLQILSKNAVGLAPYVPDPASYSFYADPGKIKEYLSCGLPVIITKVPEIAFEIEKNGAGLLVNYDKDELVEAVVKLLTDEELFINCRKNAVKLAAKYDWENIFDEALKHVLVNMINSN